MRILIVTDYYPPMLGGAVRATHLLAHELAARGHTVRVVASWQPSLPRSDDDDGILVTRVRDLVTYVRFLSSNPYQHVPPPWPDPLATSSLRRIVRSFRPDLVHSYGWLTYSTALALAGTQLPLVVSARDWSNICALGTLVRHGERCSGPRLVKCLECAGSFYGPAKGTAAVAGVLGGRRPLVRRMDGLHSMSRYVQRVLTEQLLGAGRPRRLRANVAIPDYGYVDDPGPASPDFLARLPAEPYILYVGALRVVKGVHVLLEAHRRLSPRPPLVLLGMRVPDAPTEFHDDVHVFYDVPHADVMAAWDRALFGVFPSLWAEPLGLVVHEAMFHGRPVIGARASGHEELIVDGETGYLVESGNVGELTKKMRRLIDDAALRDRMGHAARERAADITVARQMAEFEALYEKVMTATPARQHR